MCAAYEKLHGVTFREPEVGLGNARTGALAGGGGVGDAGSGDSHRFGGGAAGGAGRYNAGLKPERWDRVVELFHAAGDLPREERRAFLEQAGGGDEELCRQVEKLLKENDEPSEFLAKSPFSESAPGEIEHYTLIEKLGEGGMGSVYQAWDHRLDRLVALKFLSPRLGADAEMKERFLNEAKITSALDHPNICTIFGIEETSNGRLCIAMAYYDGRTLRQLIDSSPLAPAEALGIAEQVARGLGRAHASGVVHRDLKPANVIVMPDGLAKVLDFGIAKFRGRPGLTEPGITIGTVAYMSPEQARGKTVDARTDLWALGVVLYEMLTGRLPFTGADDVAVLYAIVHEQPAPLNEAGEEWPPGLDGLLWRAMEKDPERRYQSAGEMIADIAKLRRGVAPVAAAPRPSVVVLPFANLSRSADHGFFGDGLTEELINALARAGGVRVVSRTTAFQFKDKAVDVREIGRKLKVAAAIEGSVRVDGNRVRITAQLVKVADGYQIWSERYDREIDDIFAVQDEIANTIVGTLKQRFGRPAHQTLVKKATGDRQAYELYLKGRHYCNNWTQTGLRRGVELFSQALERDAAFAKAQAGLAVAHLLRGFWGLAPPDEAWPKVRAAAGRALELDPDLGEAHAARAAVLAIEDWDWAGAAAGFGRASELNPAEPWVRNWYATLYLNPLGRIGEAIEEAGKALELDPLSPACYASLAWLHTNEGNYDEARRYAAEGIELAPTFLENHWALAEALMEAGRTDEALRALERPYGMARDSTLTLALLARAMKLAGREREAQRFLERMESLRGGSYVAPSHLAWAHMALGNVEAALDLLEAALEIREVLVLYLNVSPLFRKIAGEPRCQAMLRRMGLSA